MLSRFKLVRSFVSAALLALPTLALQNIVQGQIIFSDDDFLAADYTTSGAGIQDIRFNFNYSNFDVFGDNFLQVTIPAAPRGGGPGVFVSANNNSTVASQLSFASISPTLANVNVGNGTANEDYVMRVDVFHSTGTGLHEAALVGTTNYSIVGINQTNTTVQMQALNDPGGGATGQGIRLSITADSGGAEDFVPVVGGALYRDRVGLATVNGRTYDGDDGVDSGLASDHINDFWIDYPDFDYVVGNGATFVTPQTNDDLNAFRGDSLFFSPDPDDLAGYHEGWTAAAPQGVNRQYWFENFGKTTVPTHFTGGTVLNTNTIRPNDNPSMQGGVPYNEWSTHELYWVDGTFTYVIDDIIVQQFTPNTGVGGNVPNAANFSQAGTAVLGLWDLFGGSIALSPDGGNFIIFDNLEFEVADAGDVPNLIAFLENEGYLPGPEGQPGDFDGDGNVDGRDFLFWQRGESPDPLSATDLAAWQANFGQGTPPPVSSLGSVPEPTSAMLLLGLASCGFLVRRKS